MEKGQGGGIKGQKKVHDLQKLLPVVNSLATNLFVPMKFLFHML